MTSKLTGEAYLNYWRDRIARGPEQVGHGGSTPEEVEAQGDLYFGQIKRAVGTHKVQSVLEFGSGWGRMLKRARGAWPEAQLVGVELCPTAANGSWLDSRTRIVCGSQVPPDVENSVNLAFTCTVLQHITDAPALQVAVLGIERALRKGGLLVLLENVELTKANHVLGWPAQLYMELFRNIDWQEEFPIVKYKDERHAVMTGKKV